MKINEVGAKKASGFAFKSLRTDKHTVAQLVRGEKPIIGNNKRNILSALSSISSAPNESNIDFLLYIADNLAYGQGRNSVFKDILDEEHITPSNRENTDWVQILDDTIKHAIASSDDDSAVDLIDEYKRIFTEKKDLTPEQKELLDLRA